MKPSLSAAVTLNLTPEEAVVFDNCLRRFAESDKLTLADASENQVFNNLLCLLERHGGVAGVLYSKPGQCVWLP